MVMTAATAAAFLFGMMVVMAATAAAALFLVVVVPAAATAAFLFAVMVMMTAAAATAATAATACMTLDADGFEGLFDLVTSRPIMPSILRCSGAAERRSPRELRPLRRRG